MYSDMKPENVFILLLISIIYFIFNILNNIFQLILDYYTESSYLNLYLIDIGSLFVDTDMRDIPDNADKGMYGTMVTVIIDI